MAMGQIGVLSTNEEVRKYINASDDDIADAMCSLLEDNNFNNEPIEVEEGWFDGY